MAKLRGILLLSLFVASLSIAFLPRLSLAQEPLLPVLYVHPTPVDAEPGGSFYIEIKIKYGVNVYAWEITLRWNASVLDCVNATEGSFLKGLEGTQTYMSAPIIRSYNSTTEEVIIGCTRLGAGIMGATGSADLVQIGFNVQAYGETDLALTNTKLRDHVPDPIEHTTTSGLFSNTAGFPKPNFTFTPAKANIGETITFDASSSVDTDQGPDHYIIAYTWDFGDGTNASETDPITYHAYSTGGIKDVTLQVTDNDMWNKSITKAVKIRFSYDVMIVEVKESVQNATIGELITITVKLSNEGANDLSEVTTRAYYASTQIGDAQTTSLVVDQTKTLSYTWDTKDMAAGNYRIKAKADVVAGEPEDAQLDNEQLGGTVALRELEQFPWMLYGGIAAVVIVVIVVAVFLLRRRGGKKQAPIR